MNVYGSLDVAQGVDNEVKSCNIGGSSILLGPYTYMYVCILGKFQESFCAGSGSRYHVRRCSLKASTRKDLWSRATVVDFERIRLPRREQERNFRGCLTAVSEHEGMRMRTGVPPCNSESTSMGPIITI